jgi:hypothetical protein
MFRSEEQEREYQSAMEQESMTQGEYMHEALRQHAGAYGEERQDQEWLLSPFDTWEKNPWYRGEPGRHPEDYDEECECGRGDACDCYATEEKAEGDVAEAEREAQDDDVPF